MCCRRQLRENPNFHKRISDNYTQPGNRQSPFQHVSNCSKYPEGLMLFLGYSDRCHFQDFTVIDTLINSVTCPPLLLKRETSVCSAGIRCLACMFTVRELVLCGRPVKYHTQGAVGLSKRASEFLIPLCFYFLCFKERLVILLNI